MQNLTAKEIILSSAHRDELYQQTLGQYSEVQIHTFLDDLCLERPNWWVKVNQNEKVRQATWGKDNTWETLKINYWILVSFTGSLKQMYGSFCHCYLVFGISSLQTWAIFKFPKLVYSLKMRTFKIACENGIYYFAIIFTTNLSWKAPTVLEKPEIFCFLHKTTATRKRHWWYSHYIFEIKKLPLVRKLQYLQPHSKPCPMAYAQNKLSCLSQG